MLEISVLQEQIHLFLAEEKAYAGTAMKVFSRFITEQAYSSSASLVQAWGEYVAGHYAVKTQRDMLAVTNRFFAYLTQCALWESWSPLPLPQMVASVKTPMTEAMALRLLDYKPPGHRLDARPKRDRAILTLLLTAGCGPGLIPYLDLYNIDPDRRRVRIKGKDYHLTILALKRMSQYIEEERPGDDPRVDCRACFLPVRRALDSDSRMTRFTVMRIWARATDALGIVSTAFDGRRYLGARVLEKTGRAGLVKKRLNLETLDPAVYGQSKPLDG